MKKPVFKHERGNAVMACYGDLSEDAAAIAMKEYYKLEKEYQDWADKQNEDKGGSTTSQIIEKILEISRTPVETALLSMVVGQSRSNPSTMPDFLGDGDLADEIRKKIQGLRGVTRWLGSLAALKPDLSAAQRGMLMSSRVGKSNRNNTATLK